MDTISIINQKELLRDSIISRLYIELSGHIKVIFIIVKGTETWRMECINVENFNLNIDQEFTNGYLVTHYKLFFKDNNFYFSFDPNDEESEISLEDNNFIYFKELKIA